jgi:L-lactate utilization protein LutB
MIDATVSRLEQNGFDVIRAETADEALSLAKRFVTPDLLVGLGGSTSVAQIGLLEWLIQNSDITLYNQYEPGITMEENYERRRQGLLSDLYITGCNAITHNGELVNADGDGNRVAAQIFGPRKVLLIVSTNKIVRDLDSAFERIHTIAAPRNIERMNTRAISFGKEPRYNERNIANKFSWIDNDKPGRTTIILVDEPLGF